MKKYNVVIVGALGTLAMNSGRYYCKGSSQLTRLNLWI